MTRILLHDETADPWDDDDRERCADCGAPLDEAGDGYDGRCADCADAADDYEDDEPDNPRDAWYPGSNLDEGPY